MKDQRKEKGKQRSHFSLLGAEMRLCETCER